MQENLVTCLNGDYLPPAQACVPVSDRGFRFGDGVFETIPIVQGVPYQWEFHLARLMRALKAIRIEAPAIDWTAYAREIRRRNHTKDGFLRIAVSRGSGSQGYLPTGNRPTWCMEILPPASAPAEPFTLWLSTIRRIPLQCLPTNSKLAHGINNTLALLEARDHGGDDALQLTVDGLVCETATATIFWLRDGMLHTPALTTGCLDGATRHALMRLSPVAVQEVEMDMAAFVDADFLAVANCRLGLWPVARLQPNNILFSTRHPLLQLLQAMLADDRAAYASMHASAW